jgi:copper chaperone CopZ
MKIDIKVGGMTCHHCAMHVKNSLLKIPGVIDAEINLMEKKATIISKQMIDEKTIEKAIDDAGYSFEGVER